MQSAGADHIRQRSGAATALVAFVLAVSLAGLSVAALAQSEAPVSGEPMKDISEPAAEPGHAELALEDLMPKIFLAYGGREALAQLASEHFVKGKQKALLNSGAMYSFRELTKGGQIRVDVDPPGPIAQSLGLAIGNAIAFDGTRAWLLSGSQVSDLPTDAALALKEAPLRHPALLSEFQRHGYVFSMLGRTTYKHTPVYAIEVTKDDGSPSTVYVDQRNFLVIGITRLLKASRGLAALVACEFSEYRPNGRTMLPFRQTVIINDRPAFELTNESITVDEVGAVPLFKKPAEAPPTRLAKPETVAAEYTHSELIVKVRLNGGEPLDFLFDTGATDTIIDRRTAADNFLDKGAGVSIAAAASAVTTQSTVIRRLDLAAVSLEDVSALILDLTPQSRQLGRRVAGIIGANVLGKFAVTIDYGKPQVVLRDAVDYQPPAGAVLVSFTTRQAPMVRAVINGREEHTFLVDTGAAFNHLTSGMASRLAPGRPEHTTEATGLDGRPVRLGTLSAESVEVGGQKVRQVSFTYPVEPEAPVDRGGFFQTNNVGVLGNPFWQNFVTTVDYRSQRLVLLPNPGVKTKEDVKQLVTTGDAQLVIHRDFRAALASYQKALAVAEAAGDGKAQARASGRLGNLYRVMARELKRPEHTRVAYDYFRKAQAQARRAGDREGEGRILADWSVLYSDLGQTVEASNTINSALLLSPQDPQVNVDYAVHLYRAKMYADMQKYVDKALFLDPSNWQALWYQVKLAETSLDVPRVKSTLKEILRFYPWSKLAREKLAALADQWAEPAPASPRR